MGMPATRNFAAATSDEPMIEMNMTPLIDVMLVLIIMFISPFPSRTMWQR